MVTPRAGAGLPILVASKEPRADGQMTRDDVEREAALMAMLEHPNVLQLVGVVTVPRTMPALLLLEYCEHGSLEQYLKNHRNVPRDVVTVTVKLSFCVDIAAGLDYLASRRVVHRDVSSSNCATCVDSLLNPQRVVVSNVVYMVILAHTCPPNASLHLFPLHHPAL